MKSIRYVVYAFFALLIVSLVIGAVSAKTGEGGNVQKMMDKESCTGDRYCYRVCDKECMNTGAYEPKAYKHEHNYRNVATVDHKL